MKKKLMAAVIALSVLLASVPIMAKEDEPEIKLIRATCYKATGNATASGCMPYEGVLAGRREDLGKIAILYDRDMQMIGIFEFRDTGGAQSLKNGTSIDVYRETLADCYEWVETYGDYVYIQIIEAEG